MDPKNQPQFNPKIPISEVLNQERAGFVPSAPRLNDVVAAISNMQAGANNSVTASPDPSATPIKNPTWPVSGNGSAPQASQIKIIKTYRSDAAEAVKMQQASVAKIAIVESERRQERNESTGATPKKRTGLLLVAVILIVVGAAAVPTVQYVLNQKKVAVSVAVKKTIIPFDYQEDLVLNNATRDEFISTLASINSKRPATSTINYLDFFEKIQDVNKKTINQKIAPDVFAGLIGPNMPSALARSFDSDYMYGTEGSDNPTTFILFKTSSYQQTFANMLHWETKMVSDLSPVLNLGTDLLDRPFTDKVIINKDIRAVSAQDGTILFLYGFLDSQTLIITTSSQTFQDVNSRYISGHFVQ